VVDAAGWRKGAVHPRVDCRWYAGFAFCEFVELKKLVVHGDRVSGRALIEGTNDAGDPQFDATVEQGCRDLAQPGFDPAIGQVFAVSTPRTTADPGSIFTAPQSVDQDALSVGGYVLPQAGVCQRLEEILEQRHGSHDAAPIERLRDDGRASYAAVQAFGDDICPMCDFLRSSGSAPSQYDAGMAERGRELLAAHAPSDVLETVMWLLENGYTLTTQRGESTFGAEFVYDGRSRVRIIVERSQWFLDVAAAPGSAWIQYDLAVAARSGTAYGERFPRLGGRSLGDPLPEQLSEGVSWRETLPDLLEWVRTADVTTAVETSRRQRSVLIGGVE